MYYQLAIDVLKKNAEVIIEARGVSMEPTIKNGDQLKIEPLKNKELMKGDILFYTRADGKCVLHRLVEKRQDPLKLNGELLLLTKGDAGLDKEEEVSLKRVLGRVIYAEREGKPFSLEERPIHLFFFRICHQIRKWGASRLTSRQKSQ